jgi:hypothetical protein
LLEERAQIVAEIEGRARTVGRPAPPRELRAPATAETTAVGRGRVGPMARSAEAAPEPPRSRRGYGLLAGLGAGLLVVIVVSTRPRPRPTTPGVPAEVAALDAATSGTEPVASDAPASPPVLASASGHTAPAARAKCDPPFRVGPPPDYIRVPKPECFTH